MPRKPKPPQWVYDIAQANKDEGRKVCFFCTDCHVAHFGVINYVCMIHEKTGEAVEYVVDLESPADINYQQVVAACDLQFLTTGTKLH